MKRSIESGGLKSPKISAEPLNCPKYLQNLCRIDLKFSVAISRSIRKKK